MNARDESFMRQAHHQCPYSPLVFGAKDAKAGSCGSVVDLFALPYNHKPEVVSGVLGEECAQLLSDFFLELRRSKERRK